MDRFLNALMLFLGLVLVVALVIGAWMMALLMPGVGDIIRAFE